MVVFRIVRKRLNGTSAGIDDEKIDFSGDCPTIRAGWCEDGLAKGAAGFHR